MFFNESSLWLADDAVQAARNQGASEQDTEAYKEKMSKLEQDFQCIKKRACIFALATAGIISFQVAFIAIPARNAYAFSSMPIIMEAAYYMVDIVCCFWFVPLTALIAGKIYLKRKRPESWQKFILEVPVIGNLIGTLYICRYFFTTSFLLNAGIDASSAKQAARKATGCEMCFQQKDDEGNTSDTDSLAIRHFERISKMMATIVDLSQMDRHVSANEHSAIADYAKSVFEDACYDAKEATAMAAISIVSIATILSVVAVMMAR